MLLLVDSNQIHTLDFTNFLSCHQVLLVLILRSDPSDGSNLEQFKACFSISDKESPNIPLNCNAFTTALAL
jgi:hypothetical protein